MARRHPAQPPVEVTSNKSHRIPFSLIVSSACPAFILVSSFSLFGLQRLI
jgi:hypothetical protein